MPLPCPQGLKLLLHFPLKVQAFVPLVAKLFPQLCFLGRQFEVEDDVRGRNPDVGGFAPLQWSNLQGKVSRERINGW